MGHLDTNGEIVQSTSSGHVALCGKWRFLRSSGEWRIIPVTKYNNTPTAILTAVQYNCGKTGRPRLKCSWLLVENNFKLPSTANYLSSQVFTVAVLRYCSVAVLLWLLLSNCLSVEDGDWNKIYTLENLHGSILISRLVCENRFKIASGERRKVPKISYKIEKLRLFLYWITLLCSALTDNWGKPKQQSSIVAISYRDFISCSQWVRNAGESLMEVIKSECVYAW